MVNHFLSKSSKFCIVRTIRFCSNFSSMWSKCLSTNVWRDFRLPLLAWAMVRYESFIRPHKDAAGRRLAPALHSGHRICSRTHEEFVLTWLACCDRPQDYSFLYAVKVKRHNVCKRSRCHWHWTYNFSLCYFNGKNLGAHFESSCRKMEQKLRRKMPGCFAVGCQHHSMRNPCQIFRFPIADSQLKR